MNVKEKKMNVDAISSNPYSYEQNIDLPKYFAIRVYSYQLQIVLVNDGYHIQMENIFELLEQTMYPSLINLQYVPLTGGLLAIYKESYHYYCIAVFSETTPIDQASEATENFLKNFERRVERTREMIPVIEI